MVIVTFCELGSSADVDADSWLGLALSEPFNMLFLGAYSVSTRPVAVYASKNAPDYELLQQD